MFLTVLKETVVAVSSSLLMVKSGTKEVFGQKFLQPCYKRLARSPVNVYPGIKFSIYIIHIAKHDSPFSTGHVHILYASFFG